MRPKVDGYVVKALNELALLMRRAGCQGRLERKLRSKGINDAKKTSGRQMRSKQVH